MNGVHDMGGMHGFGPIDAEVDEPLFHAAWEARAMALTVAMGFTGQWNIDLSRAARESLPPAVYLNASYYEIWIRGLETLMAARGLLSDAELAQIRAGQRSTTADASDAPGASPKLGRRLAPLAADAVDAALARGGPANRPRTADARFAPGDRVRARTLHPRGHTRLPRYVRGHVGTVTLVHGTHVFPDTHAATAPGAPFDEHAEWLYTVVFDAAELWGPDAEAGSEVSVDAFEPYLEPA